jgi:hypothetical protein
MVPERIRPTQAAKIGRWSGLRDTPAMTSIRASGRVARLAGYERAWLRPDVAAGVTVAAYLVPQVMTYAQLVGLDPVVGLWSAILPAIVYALVGTSRHVSTGPESTTLVLVAVAVAHLTAGPESLRRQRSPRPGGRASVPVALDWWWWSCLVPHFRPMTAITSRAASSCQRRNGRVGFRSHGCT